MIRFIPLALLSLSPLLAPASEGSSYHFGSHPARTNITFESKADIETIIGWSNTAEGSATIDWEKGTGSVDLSVPVASLRTGIDLRDEHLRGSHWFEADKFPAITFKSSKAAFAAPSTWTVTGAFAMHGVSKEIQVTADLQKVPADLAKKANLGAGDWIRVRSRFTVKLSDHGMKVPEQGAAKVQDAWTVALDLFATTEKPADRKGMPESETAKKAKAAEVKLEAAGSRYRFGVQPQLTNIVAESVTDLETVIASTTTLSGVVAIDAAKGSGQVRLSVPVASLRTGIEMRDEHLRSAHWLDAEKHPDIVFESTKASRNGDGSWSVEGTFTMHGQSKPVTVRVETKEIPAEMVKKAFWGETAGLKFRTTFSVKLSDYGVKVPDMAAAKVKDEWQVTFDAVAIGE